jgi:hypothetical protein
MVELQIILYERENRWTHYLDFNMDLTTKQQFILFIWYIFRPKKVMKFQEKVLQGMAMKFAYIEAYNFKN